MHRLIAACNSRKSVNPAHRDANNGNFTVSSRNCCRNHVEVSSSDPAPRNSAASSTTPGASNRASHPSGSASAPNPNSRSARSHSRASRINANAPSNAARSCHGSSPPINLRPGAHVVRSRSNSRNLSNSSTSCVDRDILNSLSSFPSENTAPLLPLSPPYAPASPWPRPIAALPSTASAPAPLPALAPESASRNFPASQTASPPSLPCSTSPTPPPVPPASLSRLCTPQIRPPAVSTQTAAHPKSSPALP